MATFINNFKSNASQIFEEPTQLEKLQELYKPVKKAPLTLPTLPKMTIRKTLTLKKNPPINTQDNNKNLEKNANKNAYATAAKNHPKANQVGIYSQEDLKNIERAQTILENKTIYKNFEKLGNFKIRVDPNIPLVPVTFDLSTSDISYGVFIKAVFNQLITQGKSPALEFFIANLFLIYKDLTKDNEETPIFKVAQLASFDKAIHNWHKHANTKIQKREFILRLNSFINHVNECYACFKKQLNQKEAIALNEEKQRKEILEQEKLKYQAQEKSDEIEKQKQVTQKIELETNEQVSNVDAGAAAANGNTKLKIKRSAKFIYTSEKLANEKLLSGLQKNGEELQITKNNPGKPIELVMGLDFGTSSTKVVISNNASNRSYGVEFNNSSSDKSYFLPTTLYQTDSRFSLIKGDIQHRNLKLSFLDDPNNIDHQVRLVAYLAFVMARARGYLYQNFEAELKGPEFYWKVSAGFAGKNIANLPQASLYKRLLFVAWSFSTITACVTEKSIRKEIQDINSITDQAELEEYYSDFSPAEIEVQPEITAQIYAFIKSTSFDPKAKNHFMIADVGAGTIDTAIFNVKQNKFGSWDFSIFKDTVERNGVAELHRTRLAWWLKQLKHNKATKELVNAVESVPQDTDQINHYPANYLDYFDGIEHLDERDSNLNPDLHFYKTRILDQIRNKTLYQVFLDKQLDPNEIKNMPFYLCGGGSRMELYKRTTEALRLAPAGTTWLCANYKELAKPTHLNAKHLNEENYDRLSVAYGLSNMLVGKTNVPVALPLKKANTEFTGNYVGKELT